MLNDENLKVVYYEQKSSNVFPNTDIKGGVVVLLHDKERKFGKIGTFISSEELGFILEKVTNKTEKAIDAFISSRGSYRLTEKALSECSQITKLQSKGHKHDVGTSAFRILDDIVYFQNKPNDANEYVRFMGLLNNQRVYRYVRKDFVNEPYGFASFKVVLPKSNGSGTFGEVLSSPLVVEPYVGFTETFISIGCFNSKTEAENCLKYIKSKFARALLGVLKVTQDNPREKWAKVPMQDFTPESDIDWSQSIPNIDRLLYAKYELSDDEKEFIEENVKAME